MEKKFTEVASKKIGITSIKNKTSVNKRRSSAPTNAIGMIIIRKNKKIKNFNSIFLTGRTETQPEETLSQKVKKCLKEHKCRCFHETGERTAGRGTLRCSSAARVPHGQVFVFYPDNIPIVVYRVFTTCNF
ncbi:MAG: hypothetical protein WCT05_06510 [Lentisphaeria bacterium]